MRHWIVLLILALFGTMAHAALPEESYEAARRNAANVVVIAVQRVSDLPPERGYGHCRVRGRVAAVERGSRYALGQAIAIIVPCMRPFASIPLGPAQWQDAASLETSAWGRAYLDAEGRLARDQYRILPAYP